jgi:hypothetical protein
VQLTGVELMTTGSKVRRQVIPSKIFALLLVMFVFTNVGCSTPQLPYVDPDPPDTAWYAYQQCLANHPAANRRYSPCDHAGDQNQQSQYYYTNMVDSMNMGYGSGYSNSNSNWARGYRSTARGTAETSGQDDSYRAFLKTLDDESLRVLRAEWQALANTK